MKYIIEYRDGSFFNPDYDTGVSREKAKQFPSKKKAETFLRKKCNEWIRFYGGMVIPLIKKT